MNHDIQSGDTCKIIAGFTRKKSPNIGLIVKVGATIPGKHGEPHSQFGRIVRITGDVVYQLSDGGDFFNAGWADIPVIWLEKIKPDAPPPNAQIIEKEITA